MSGGHAHHHHDHDHSHGHSHAPKDFGPAFGIGIVLNVGFVAAEAVFGLFAHSMALLADAGHNLSDVLGLAAAWGAATLARRPPSHRFTYGLGASTILAALFNATVLMVVVGGIAWEAIHRFAAPQPTAGATVMLVAAAGILVNGLTAALFISGRKQDLNVRGAFLHMASDAAVSAGVVAAGLVITFTGWLWLDPAASLGVVVVIVWGTWSLLRDSVAMSLAGVPEHVDTGKVRAYLAALPGAAEVHDLHIWSTSTTDTALTAHLVMPAGHPGDDRLHAICSELHDRFGIGHATLQVETGAGGDCRLAAEHPL